MEIAPSPASVVVSVISDMESEAESDVAKLLTAVDLESILSLRERLPLLVLQQDNTSVYSANIMQNMTHHFSQPRWNMHAKVFERVYKSEIFFTKKKCQLKHT